MSFRCDVCNEPSGGGVSPTIVVTRIRKRIYQANQSVIPGHEIVCEVKACVNCKDTLGEPVVNISDVPLAMGLELPEFEGNIV